MKNKQIEQALRVIAAKHRGILRPEHVVAEAENPKHVLHPKFTWDDTEAARQHRLWQARQLIAVSVEVLGDKLDPSPVFVSLSTDRHRKGGYRVTTDVLNDAQLRDQLLQDALFELNRFQLKYRNLRQLAQVFSAIRKVKKAA